MLLTTPTAIKVNGVATWIHHTHIRLADPHDRLEDYTSQWKINRDTDNPLKLKLCRS
jgi:hypothetical protein